MTFSYFNILFRNLRYTVLVHSIKTILDNTMKEKTKINDILRKPTRIYNMQGLLDILLGWKKIMFEVGLAQNKF